jgi:hypothetical protein
MTSVGGEAYQVGMAAGEAGQGPGWRPGRQSEDGMAAREPGRGPEAGEATAAAAQPRRSPYSRVGSLPLGQ